MTNANFPPGKPRILSGFPRGWPLAYLAIVFTAAAPLLFLDWEKRGIQTVIFLALAAICVVWLITSLSYLLGFRSELDQVTRFLDNLRDHREDQDAGIGEERKMVAAFLEDLPHVHAARGLIQPSDSTSSSANSTAIQLEPDAFTLTPRAVLDQIPTLMRVGIEHIPAIFTALGILFTFIGLISGLKNLDPTDTAKLAEGLPQLLQGVGLAFESSLAGIFLSFMALIAARGSMASVSRTCDKLRTQAHQLDRKAAPEHVLQRMEDNAAKLNHSIRELIDIAKNQDAKIGSLATDLATSLIEPLKDALDQNLAKPLQQMGDSLDTFATRQLDEHSKALDQVFQSFNENFSQNLGTQFGRLDSVLHGVITWHEATRELYEETWKNLQTHALAQQKLTEGQVSLLSEQSRLEAERTTQLKALQEHSEAAVAHLNTLADSLTQHSERMENMTTTLDEVRAGLDATTHQLTHSSHALIEANREMDARLQGQINTVQTLFIDSMKALEETFIGLPERYAEQMRQIRQELESGIQQTFSQFDQESAKIVQRLSGSYLSMESGIEQLNQTVNSLENQVKRLNQWQAADQAKKQPQPSPAE